MKDPHFDKIYWYIVGNGLLVFAYIVAVSFMPLPKENQRFVDIAFGILLGTLNTNSSFLTGGSPMKKDGEVNTKTATVNADKAIVNDNSKPDESSKEL